MAKSSRRSRKTASGPPPGRGGPVLKTPDEIDAMAAAGALLAGCHDAVANAAAVGVTTAELDRIAEEFIRAHGATPAFKGYHGFPGSICPSINEQVVHAIPNDRALVDGDLLSIDIGLELDGWVADRATTLSIGAVSGLATRLVAATRQGLARGIEAARPGGHIGDIGHAVQTEIEGAGFCVVRALVGHGIGRSMHEDPQVPNFGRPGSGVPLVEGIVIAIEPMVNVGTPEIAMADDGWTISTADGSLSAHEEHTVAITADGPRILTMA